MLIPYLRREGRISTSKIIIIIFLLFSCTLVNRVITQNSQYHESIIDLAEGEDYSDWLEYLWELKEKPLNLNQASFNELNQIPFLTPQIIRNIVKYRRANGQINNLSELKNITGINQELLDAIEQFVTIQELASKPKFIYQFQSRIESPKKEGYLKDYYSNPIYVRQKLLYQYNNNISGAIITEKDAGEKNITDYTSFHIHFKNIAQKINLLIGDYQIRIGAGLTYWSTYGIPISLDAIPIEPKFSSNIIGNRSSNEFAYFRGAALNYNITNNCEFTFLYSRVSRDASLSEDKSIIKNSYTSGLHRTTNEKSKRNTMKEATIGGMLKIKFRKSQIKLSTLSQQLNLPYQNFGDKHLYYSLTFSLLFKDIQSTGEFSLFQGKIPAFHNSLYFSNNKIKYQIIGYYYAPHFFSLHGKTLGSFYLIPNNQYGSLCILKYRINRFTSISAFLHLYRQIFTSSEIPFVYKSLYFEVSHKHRNNQFKIWLKQYYRKNSLSVSPNIEKNISALRLEHIFKIHKNVKTRNRLEMRWANPLKSNIRYYSLSFFQQFEWHPLRNCKFIIRWTTFDVPDYDLRIYEYENDLPGSYRSILLNNRGIKWFFLFHLGLTQNVKLDFKYQQRYYPELSSVGTGWDTIHHPRIHDFRISLVWKY